MAPTSDINFLLVSAAVLIAVFPASIISNSENPDSTCQYAISSFDHPISGEVDKDRRQCYVFTYNFTLDQDWAAYLCVKSPQVSRHTPLLIVVREYLSVMSFQVPQIFDDAHQNSFTNVCHTLCPLANYFDDMLKASQQNIFVEITSQSNVPVHFEIELKNLSDFVITKEKPLTVNITPSQPRVMQYTMEDDLNAVRIEAKSSDESCMIFSIQHIQCPFSDTEISVERFGFYQTLMTQSGIAITRKTFPMGRVYVALLLKTSNDDCTEMSNHGMIPVQFLSKEVDVRIVPAINNENYYEAVFGAFGFFVIIYIFTLIVCLYLKTRKNPESKAVDIENSSLPNYGTSSELESRSSMNFATSSDLESPSTQNCEASSDADYRTFQEAPRRQSSVSIDETDMDTLPDANVDKNVVRTKTIVHVSDLARKNEKVLSKRSKVYSWNLFTIAIFYGLPVIQLVYINQRIVNLTGNQDLCYYNFLCSHQVGVFSDFNHVYSNLGYVMLGILFFMIVWRRETLCKAAIKDKSRERQEEVTGIPDHFGLLYAMGLALIIEGVLSGCYHVCPNKSNFQFDTAFMYVISVVCMLKLYQARHPDITAESHTTWMVLAVVIFIGVGGVIKDFFDELINIYSKIWGLGLTHPSTRDDFSSC